MPKIPDIFCGMEHFCYATTIDLNVGYISMLLSETAKQLCVTSLPWGLYQYNMLPMGIKPATDIFQQQMGTLFFDMYYASCYAGWFLDISWYRYVLYVLNCTGGTHLPVWQQQFFLIFAF